MYTILKFVGEMYTRGKNYERIQVGLKEEKEQHDAILNIFNTIHGCVAFDCILWYVTGAF